MAQGIDLYPLGIGDFGAKQLWHTNFVLRMGARNLVVDCPRRWSPMLQDNRLQGEWKLGLEDYDLLLLTHLHIDHAGGLVEMVRDGQVSPDSPLALQAPAPLLDDLWSNREEPGVVSAALFPNGVADLERHFRPVAIQDGEDFGDFRLQYRLTRHIANTFAYRLDVGGFRIGFSADSAFDPELIAWLDPCDVIVHDVLLPPWALVAEVQKLHAPLAMLLELPRAFQEKTFLCHVDANTYRDYSSQLGGYRFLEQQRLYRLR